MNQRATSAAAALAVAMFMTAPLSSGEFGDNLQIIDFNGARTVFGGDSGSRNASPQNAFLISTLFGEFLVEFLPDTQNATQVRLTARNSSNVTSKGVKTTQTSAATNKVINRIFFEAFDSTSGGATSDDLNISFTATFDLLDPVTSQPTESSVFFTSLLNLVDEAENNYFTAAGTTFLDSNASSTPTSGGSFSGVNSSNSGGGLFANSVNYNATASGVPTDTPLGLESETFGNVFNDGFESGDTSSWGFDSSNTFILTITATNPNVRFRRVQKDVVVQPDAILNNQGQNFITARPNPRQTAKATVTGKKRFNWIVENNGPDTNLESGPRAILLRGPKTSARLTFTYRNRGANVTGAIGRGAFALPSKEAGQGELIVVEAKAKRRRSGSRRQESFNLDARTPAGRADVARLQLTTN